MGGQRLICSISSHVFHKGQQAYLIVCAPLAPARRTEHHMSPMIKVTLSLDATFKTNQILIPFQNSTTDIQYHKKDGFFNLHTNVLKEYPNRIIVRQVKSCFSSLHALL